MSAQPRQLQEGDIRKEVVATGKYSLIYVAGTALSRAIGFFMIPVYTRFIAPSDYGLMELIEIVISVMTIIMSLGVSEGMARFYYGEKGEEDRNRVVSTAILGLAIIGGSMVVFFCLFSGPIAKHLLDSAQNSYFLQIAITAAWFTMLSDLGLSYLRMIYMAKLFVTATTVQLLLALSLNIWFIVYREMGILGIFYSTLISQAVVSSVLAFVILRKTRMRLSLAILRELISFGIPLVPSRIGVMIGFMSNRFFLRWMTTADPVVALTQIGLFSLGHKFGVIINRLVNAPFNSFWAPRRMELLLSGNTDARRTVARICTYAVACLLYLALLLSAGVESLIDIMADPRYKGAHVVVPFVALSYVFLGLETHFSAGIFHQKKTKWASYITFCSVPLILLWNYLLIPRWGLIGAATSNLAGGFLRVVLLYVVSQRLSHIPYEVGRLCLIFAVSFVLYFLAQAVAFSSPWHTLAGRVLVALTLPLFLLPMRWYHAGELEFVRDLMLRGKRCCSAAIEKKNL
jgi:O-antigen/teichoic acid export membrane protein